MDRFGDVFRATFEVAPVGIAHVAPDGSFLRVNSRLCEIVGYPADELVALRFHDITHPEDLDADLGLLQDIVDGRSDRYEMAKRYVRADGRIVWARLTVSVLRDADGSPGVFVAIIDDIDEARRTSDALSAALQQLESHFRNTPLGVVEWDGEFRVKRWSGAAADVFGYSEAEVRGKSPEEIGFVHEPDAEAVGAVMAELLDGSVDANVSSNRNIHRDGHIVSSIWYNSVIRLPEGGFSILSLVNDVTEAEAARAAEVRLRGELEARVEARTEELASTVLQLQRSNADLERFAYIASHDLQEPLRMVSSYTQLLAERYRGQLDERADQFIHYAVDGAERMRRLILDLLEYSRVGRGDSEPVAVALDDCLDAALVTLGERIAVTGARIRREPLPRVLGIDSLLVRLLQNLVGNALKFVEPGAVPVIHIAATRRGGAWEIAVIDEGIGIAPDAAQRVFEPFQRLHRRQAYDGTGIGLSICQRAVERLGGRIWVEPAPGGGAAFRFTLPDAGEMPPGPPR